MKMQLVVLHMLEGMGYRSLQVEDKSEEAYYYSAANKDGDSVTVKVVIDDEMTYDDWSVFEQHEGECNWKIVR
ncbi:hypothetical protein [Paenibacillus elgii]|uniref:hypothetical protein n=1 Tax=Paenibacillus elgii TaxID=189691 RepID=UPI0013D62F5F|nr:hypothetical protein [Paenibacillus elgii]